MIKTSRKGHCMFVFLSGEIDHYASAIIRKEIEESISSRDIQTLHLDFSDVSFIDSSGVGMLIGRYKTMKEKGGGISAGGLAPSVERLYRLAGLHRIIPITANGGIHEQE